MRRMRQFGMVVAAILLAAGIAEAQGSVNRFYIMPKAGDGTPRTNPFHFKYIDSYDQNGDNTRLAGVGIATGADYGEEPVYLVMADVNNSAHNFLASQPDVIAAPENLDTQLGSDFSSVRAKLELLRIPEEFAPSASVSWRYLLRRISSLFLFAQRFNGEYDPAKMFPAGVEMNTQWQQLDLDTQLRYQSTARWFGFILAGPGGNLAPQDQLRKLFQVVTKFVPFGFPL
jgi:hypothetical protein